MSDKTEGTVVLDGLVEGRLGPLPDTEKRLRAWVRAAAGAKLPFTLEIDGGSFSVLADNTPIDVEALAFKPARTVAEALDELVKVFPTGHRAAVLSTVRSMEYRANIEIQTVYAVGPDGEIHTQERTVEAVTKAPPKPLTRKEKIRLGVTGLIFALLIFAVSSIFIDYRGLFRSVAETVTPYDTEAMKVETGGFGEYFTVEGKKVVSHRGVSSLRLTLKRTKAFPRTDAALKAALAKSPDSLSKRLTVEALARGYVRCESFDKDGKFIAFTTRRITDLRTKETVDVDVPLPAKGRPTRVVITY